MKTPALFGLPRLRYRIVAVFLGLLVAVQVVSLALLSRSIERSASEAVLSQVQTGQRVFNQVLAQNHARLRDAAALLAVDFGFRSAVASGDVQTLQSALQTQAERIRAPVALYTDSQFKLKASTHGSAERFLPSLRRMAAQPLNGEGHVVVLEGAAYEMVAVPIKTHAIVGWIALGFPIDDALLTEVRKLSGVDVVLMWHHTDPPRWEAVRASMDADAARGVVIPWTLARSQPTPLLTTSELAQVESYSSKAEPIDEATRALKLVLPGGAGQADIPAVAVEFALGHADLEADEAGMRAVVIRSTQAAAAPYAALERQLLLASLVGCFVFGVVSFFTANHITTPLKDLTRSARKLGRGEYEEPVVAQSRDEIGALATAFETMRHAVREREQEVRRLAFEDRLTALPNRESFRTEVRAAIEASAGAMTQPFAVVMLDLDRFKQINDVLGHRFGDGLLREVARRLCDEGRRDAKDLVARVGGDAFALLLPGADAQTAKEVAQRIRRSWEQPIRLDDHTVDLGAGIGVACYPAHAREADALLSRAEIATQEAKRRGLTVVVYDPALDSTSEESLSLLSELRHAITHDQLRLYLQPKIALQSGTVIGAEALVRWQHPQRGLVPPAQFIPFAEQSGFIRELTGWVLERGTRILQDIDSGRGTLKLAVNLSTRDLLDPELPDKLDRMVRTQGVDPRTLCLEITESVIMEDPQRAMQTLDTIHGQGFKLSIDDFGTGYSSLAYLKRLPVNELKVDKSFVLNMQRDLNDAKIVRSTIDLAHNLGLSVVAEGVENVEVFKLLQGLKCDEAQGYFIAKPMPEAQFANWVQAWRAPALSAVRLDTDFARLVG